LTPSGVKIQGYKELQNYTKYKEQRQKALLAYQVLMGAIGIPASSKG